MNNVYRVTFRALKPIDGFPPLEFSRLIIANTVTQIGAYIAGTGVREEIVRIELLGPVAYAVADRAREPEESR